MKVGGVVGWGVKVGGVVQWGVNVAGVVGWGVKVGEVVVNNNLEPMTRCGTVFFGGLLY